MEHFPAGNYFNLITKNRIYHLYASSAKLAKEWCDIINQCISMQKNQSSTQPSANPFPNSLPNLDNNNNLKTDNVAKPLPPLPQENINNNNSSIFFKYFIIIFLFKDLYPLLSDPNNFQPFYSSNISGQKDSIDYVSYLYLFFIFN